VSSIPYGQSEQVTFYYNAPESGNNYVFQYWVIGGQTYYQTNPSITETYTFTWTSDWSGTGTFTYSFTGQVEISYPNTVSGAPTWSATVTLPGGTVAAQGSGNLNVASYPTPPNQNYIVVCKVSGGGTINGVSAGAGIEYGTADISCTLQSNRGP
jgi:hypothetical protein